MGGWDGARRGHGEVPVLQQAGPMSTLDDDAAAAGRTAWLEGRAVLRLRACRLAVVEGPVAGREVLSVRERLTVGAHPTNHLPLTEDAAVSRHHLEVCHTPQGWVVVDVGSTNGTFLDGRRVERAPLGTSALLRAGECLLSFEARPQEVPVPGARPAFEAPLDEATWQALCPLLAPLDAPVLLRGPPAPVEAAARALHAPRADSSFALLDEVDGLATPGTLFVPSLHTLSDALQSRLLREVEAGLWRVVAGAPVDEALEAVRPELLARLSPLSVAVPGGLPAPRPVAAGRPFAQAKALVVDDFEKAYLAALLRRHHGNVSAAARESGLHRKSIERLTRKHGLDVDGYRG
jgi:hypothetical protein